MRTAILGIGTAVPPRAYNSDEVFELAGYGRQAIRSIFRNSGIDRRHLALEAGHRIQNDPQWFSDHYATWAPRLAEQAALDALREARVEAAKIDYRSSRAARVTCALA
jgi:3-oxoacyl-[acyl-carrier-protein] synthase III